MAKTPPKSDEKPGSGWGGVALGVIVALGGLFVVGRFQAAKQREETARAELSRALPALARTTVGPHDDLAKKRAELRASVARIETLADDAGAPGEVLRCSARGLEVQLSAAIGFQEASRADAKAGLDPASWKSRSDLGTTREMLERRRTALEAMKKALSGGAVDAATRCMKERGVDAKTVADTETSAKAARPPQQEELFTVQSDMLGESTSLLALLERSWGSWRLVGGSSLEFDDPVIGRDYVARTRRIAELDVRETELLRGVQSHVESVRVAWPVEAAKAAPSASSSAKP